MRESYFCISYVAFRSFVVLDWSAGEKILERKVLDNPDHKEYLDRAFNELRKCITLGNDTYVKKIVLSDWVIYIAGSLEDGGDTSKTDVENDLEENVFPSNLMHEYLDLFTNEHPDILEAIGFEEWY